jgi:hypothetical protein
MEHRVIDDDAGALVRTALSEVALLRLDVATNAGVLGIWNRAVTVRHPPRGHLERDVEQYREIPRAHQLFAVQEQPVDDKDRTCGSDAVGRVEDQIACQVVRPNTVLARGGRHQVGHLSHELGAIELGFIAIGGIGRHVDIFASPQWAACGLGQ